MASSSNQLPDPPAAGDQAQASPQATSPGRTPVTETDHVSYTIPQRQGFLEQFIGPVAQDPAAVLPGRPPASWGAMAPDARQQVTTCGPPGVLGGGWAPTAAMPQQGPGWQGPAPSPPPVPPGPAQQTFSGGWATSNGWSQPQQAHFGQQTTPPHYSQAWQQTSPQSCFIGTPNQWSTPGHAAHWGERRGAGDQGQSSPQWQGRPASSTTVQRCKKPCGQCGQQCSFHIDATGRHANGAPFCLCERCHHTHINAWSIQRLLRARAPMAHTRHRGGRTLQEADSWSSEMFHLLMEVPRRSRTT